MKKEGVFLFVIISVLLISFLSISVLAEDTEIDKAYDCLEDKVKDICETLTVEEQSFTVLAIGRCSSELEDKGKDDECWPSGGCRLRDTSLAILALDRVGKSTTDAEDWLLDQKKIPTDLIWYLEIDSDEETTCEINYGSTKRSVTIGEDKKINRGAGSCLTLARDNYWLRIDDDCYEVNFTISCDKGFISTLLYEKTAGSTVYVSSEIESAPAEGSTEHRVNAFCFKQGNSCNYEGSLWAALALAKTNNDISAFLPYLIAMEEDNEEYFPSAFLYILTNYDEYFTKVIEEQKDDYWKIEDSPYHHFYDTSLALYSLYGTSAEQIDNAKTYLFEVQGDNGCWRDNIRDTAFILYAIEPRAVSAVGGSMDDCKDYGYYCTSPLDCSQDNVLDNFVCYGGKVCCEVEPKEETCDEKGGTECTDDQECTGATVIASNTDECCKGSCIAKDQEPECEKEGYNCRYSCLDDEEEKVYDCNGAEVCCAPKPVSEGGYWWIWVLVILIILVVIGMIFKDRLRVLLSKIKGGFGKRRGPAPGAPGPRPGFPPRGIPGRPGPRPRMMVPRQPGRPVGRPGPVRRAGTKSDKELEETLKKLREMSK